MGEQTVFHAGHEHQRKFQALGRMQGHELHAVVPGLALGLAGLERGVAEERLQLGQPGVGVLARQGKSVGGIDQFVEVLQPVLAFPIGLVEGDEARRLQHVLDDLAQGQALRRLAHRGTDLAEIRKQTAANLSVDLQENYRLVTDVAPHVDKVRYNPGHLYHHEREKPWQDKVRYIAGIAAERPSRITASVSVDDDQLDADYFFVEGANEVLELKKEKHPWWLLLFFSQYIFTNFP